MSAEDLVETSIASVGSSNERPARISASRCTSRGFAELERARVWQLACSPNPGCEPCDRGWPGFWPRYAALWSAALWSEALWSAAYGQRTRICLRTRRRPAEGAVSVRGR
jgi:hypothetical protein